MSEPVVFLRQSPQCVVVLKPSGVATQAPPGIDSMEQRLRSWGLESSGAEGDPYIGVPHRLDRAASGALVFTLTKSAARKLSKQFERRSVRKVYWALAGGDVQPDQGAWEDYVQKIYGHPRTKIVPPDAPHARFARLMYRVLRRLPAASLLEIELETGRTHQVRVQAAARGWPILGDDLYGSPEKFGAAHQDNRLLAIALHARRIEFIEPGTNERVSVVAPLPPSWLDYGVGEPAGAEVAPP